ncbi:MAG: BamA/TamA family outer membrane protein [Candidatus Eisenbacteria bacterium]|nr:BamA/TamA family outer membrane protein [Candidatus Eisenbacteria bacterium]
MSRMPSMSCSQRRTAGTVPRNRAHHPWLPAMIAALAVLALAVPQSPAQYFGRNKVQYHDLDWSVLETDNFELYFYERESEAAADVARMAERAYRRLSRILNHEIEDKIPLILYASHTDFQESNVTSALISEGTGGFTEFLKRRVALPITGSYADFDHVLTHELVHAFQIDILWGKRDRSLGNPFAYSPPLWVMEGMAEYLSQGVVDDHTQMWLRDAALQGYLTSLEELSYVYDIRVYRFGQAIMAYIGQTYGDESVGAIFRSMARTKSIERAVEDVLGMSLEKLSEDWTESVRRTYLPQIAEHEKPIAFATQLTDHEEEGSSLNLSPAISPDGSLMVFLSDRSLYNDLYLASAVDGKVLHRLIKGERREAFESLRFLDATFSWAPDNRRIAFVAKVGAQDAIYIMDVREKEILARHVFDLDGLQAPAWSPGGDEIAFVGLHGGRSDLFLVNADGSGLRPLTSDRFMVREPRFSPDGRSIAFVTDRGPETDWANLIFGPPRVAVYELGSGEINVLPDQEGKNISPHWSPQGDKILYVSDRSGISNIYARDLISHEDDALTDVLTGVTGLVPLGSAMSLSADGRRLVFTSFRRGGWDIYAMKDPLDRIGEELTPAPSGRPEAPLFVQVRRSPPGGEVMDLRELPSPRILPDSAGGPPVTPAAMEDGSDDDPLNRDLDSLEVVVRDEPGLGREKVREAFRNEDEEREPVDVREVFDATQELPDSSGFTLRDYSPKFSVDYVSAGGYFASNVGLAAQSLLYFSDVLGNHNIVIGADVYGSFEDSNLLLQYYNLANRINWGVAAFQYRNDFFIFTARDEEEFTSQIYRGVEVSLQRPFSRFRRIELRLQGLNVDETVYRESFGDSPIFVQDSHEQLYYLSPGIALVKDNTLYGPTGPISGSRYRYSVDGAVGDLSYMTGILDHRRYFNISRRYAFAVRLVGASSHGRDPQHFRIGGPYTLRGYDYGELGGTRTAFANFEFRFPLIEQLRLGWPLPLEFRGIRGALFFDLGAAWTDSERFRAFGETEEGRFRLDDLKASYGIGAALNMGFLVLRWDLAQATDLARGTKAARGEVSFGAEF